MGGPPPEETGRERAGISLLLKRNHKIIKTLAGKDTHRRQARTCCHLYVKLVLHPGLAKARSGPAHTEKELQLLDQAFENLVAMGLALPPKVGPPAPAHLPGTLTGVTEDTVVPSCPREFVLLSNRHPPVTATRPRFIVPPCTALPGVAGLTSQACTDAGGRGTQPELASF